MFVVLFMFWCFAFEWVCVGFVCLLFYVWLVDIAIVCVLLMLLFVCVCFGITVCLVGWLLNWCLVAYWFVILVFLVVFCLLVIRLGVICSVAFYILLPGFIVLYVLFASWLFCNVGNSVDNLVLDFVVWVYIGLLERVFFVLVLLLLFVFVICFLCGGCFVVLLLA